MTHFKSIIEQALEAADHAPSELREATYKVVLSYLLIGAKQSLKTDAQSGKAAPTSNGEWLAKVGITAEEWQRVYDEDESGIHIVTRRIPGNKMSKQQTNLALLLAMKLWKEKGQIALFGASELAELCRDHSCHDGNISKNIMGAGYFRQEGRNYKLIKAGEDAAIVLVKQLGGGESNG